MRKETADMLKTETHVYDQFFFMETWVLSHKNVFTIEKCVKTWYK